MLAPRPITERFLDELAHAPLPARIRLVGHETSCAVAAALIKEHAPAIIVVSDETGDATTVTCTSMEHFGTMMLAAFLEGDAEVDGEREANRPIGPGAPSDSRELPDHPLLWSVSEAQIDEYARDRSIPTTPWPTSDVRRMLDRIAHKQPQTYHSLSRGMIRLQPHILRVFDAKQDKA